MRCRASSLVWIVELVSGYLGVRLRYQLVIPMTKDSSLGLSSHNKFTIRNKSLFLLRAYQVALSKLRVGVKWITDCWNQGQDACPGATDAHVPSIQNTGQTSGGGSCIVRFWRERALECAHTRRGLSIPVPSNQLRTDGVLGRT